jgi:serine/threonine protein kinase
MTEFSETTEGLVLRKHRCLKCSVEFDSGNESDSCPGCHVPCVLVTQDPLLGQTIGGKYHVTHLLAAGGMGRVYNAFHEHLKTDVAIKVLPGTGMSVDRLKRFQHEAQLASSIVHPGIVRILDFGVDPVTFLVMEKASGRTLREEIRETGGIDSARAIQIGIGVCDAMQAAHIAGLLHRDLKPSNVMVEPLTGAVKIIDFGLAKAFLDDVKLTKTGETVGSPPYMSPEQCRGEPLDVRSDIYSFGCMMYEVLTGRPPFESEHMIAAIFNHLEEQAKLLKQARPDLSFPKGLDTVLKNCLNKSPDKRYQTMFALKEDLTKVSQAKTVKPITVPRRKRNKNLMRFAIAAFGVPLIFLLNLLLQWESVPPPVFNANELATGKQSVVGGPISVKIRDRICMNRLTKEQFVQLRSQQLEENKLLVRPYRLTGPTFEKVDFAVPWPSYEGLYYVNSAGPSVVEGKSASSVTCMNPLLLVEPWLGDVPGWRKDFIGDNQALIGNFPHCGRVTGLTFDPARQQSEATYDITDWVERLNEANDWIDYYYDSYPTEDLQQHPDGCLMPLHVAHTSVNAWDFGYNYMYVTAEKDGKGKPVTNQPIRVCQIFHRVGSSFVGVDCNVAHLPRGNNYRFSASTELYMPCRERISLWKHEPKSANQAPDFTCFLNFVLEPDRLADPKYLRERVVEVQKLEGPDSRSLISIYRRLGKATRAKSRPDLQDPLAAQYYGEAIRIAGKFKREAGVDLQNWILPEFLSSMKGDAADLSMVEHIAREQKWTPATLEMVRRAMTTGECFSAQFWKNYTFLLAEGTKFEQCIAACKKGLKFHPNVVLLYMNLSASYARLKRWSDAETAARKAVLLSPEDSNGLVLLSWVLLQRDKHDEALKYSTKAVKVTPDSVNANLYLCLAACSTGDTKTAVDAARKAYALSRNDYNLILNLAHALKAANQSAEARVFYEAAKKLTADPDALRSIEDSIAGRSP